jgi:hypothetical protein
MFFAAFPRIFIDILPLFQDYIQTQLVFYPNNWVNSFIKFVFLDKPIYLCNKNDPYLIV